MRVSIDRKEQKPKIGKKIFVDTPWPAEWEEPCLRHHRRRLAVPSFILTSFGPLCEMAGSLRSCLEWERRYSERTHVFREREQRLSRTTAGIQFREPLLFARVR